MAREAYPGVVLDLLAAAGDRPVFEHGARVVTGSAMLGLVRRIAAGLRGAGIGPGDGLAMMLGVTPEAFAAIMASHVVGARVCGIRPGLPDERLRHLLRRDATAVVTDATTTVVTDATTGTEATGATTGPVAGPRRLALADLVSTPDPGDDPKPAGRPHDVARLVYTSGSTGRPKACAQTYAGMAAAWAARPAAWPPVVRDLAARLGRYLVFGSLSSQVMIEYGVLALAAGGAMVVADPPDLPGAIVRHRGSGLVITVPRLRRLVAAQRADPVDLGCLRALMVSGSPLPAGLHREALDVLGPVVFHGYGQTETGMISMATPADPPGSVGTPPAAVDVVVRGPDGAPVPVGVDGELYVRTPAQAVGYWADPAETAEVFVDGWVRTRDLGHLDPAGRLHLVGRARTSSSSTPTCTTPGPSSGPWPAIRTWPRRTWSPSRTPTPARRCTPSSYRWRAGPPRTTRCASWSPGGSVPPASRPGSPRSPNHRWRPAASRTSGC
ncbi:fatty acid--CoA ligase family protein [Micromonospora zhanjiangensis]